MPRSRPNSAQAKVVRIPRSLKRGERSKAITSRGPTSGADRFVGQYFWARGYCISTVGRDEVAIREYIQKQQEEIKRLDCLTMFGE
jgi:REP element-mobilizing transposase RayT